MNSTKRIAEPHTIPAAVAGPVIEIRTSIPLSVSDSSNVFKMRARILGRALTHHRTNKLGLLFTRSIALTMCLSQFGAGGRL